jgi:DNA repair protein RadA/Sms
MARTTVRPGTVVTLDAVQKTTRPRMMSGNSELDRVLGGGIVPGAVLLLAGEPGIGKSTLLLSLAKDTSQSILYIAGEESPEQIALRAARLGVKNAAVSFLTDTDTDVITATIAHLKPRLVIIDSIQTVRTPSAESEAGTVTQLRASGAMIAAVAKETGIPIILVGQVTKDGSIAGPKTLEHLVDVVLSFEGDAAGGLRMLRAEKNRFGPTDEVAIFRMATNGLVPETNPSKILLADRRSGASGSAVCCFLEGNRPLLVEIQALVVKSPYPNPIRRTSGYDTSRLQMLLAVLERRSGIGFSGADVHINVVGGVALRDPSTDLAVALALASAVSDTPLDPHMVAIGEIGLGGEVRSVSHLEKRLAECAALGFTTVLGPGTPQKKTTVTYRSIETLGDALGAAGIRTN